MCYHKYEHNILCQGYQIISRPCIISHVASFCCVALIYFFAVWTCPWSLNSLSLQMRACTVCAIYPRTETMHYALSQVRTQYEILSRTSDHTQTMHHYSCPHLLSTIISSPASRHKLLNISCINGCHDIGTNSFLFQCNINNCGHELLIFHKWTRLKIWIFIIFRRTFFFFFFFFFFTLTSKGYFTLCEFSSFFWTQIAPNVDLNQNVCTHIVQLY